MSEIITQLEQATPFQLWSLSALIDRLLEDPNKLMQVKQELRLGQQVTYFIPEENRDVSATIVKILHPHVLVKNAHDDKGPKITLKTPGSTGINGVMKLSQM